MNCDAVLCNFEYATGKRIKADTFYARKELGIVSWWIVVKVLLCKDDQKCI